MWLLYSQFAKPLLYMVVETWSHDNITKVMAAACCFRMVIIRFPFDYIYKLAVRNIRLMRRKLMLASDSIVDVSKIGTWFNTLIGSCFQIVKVLSLRKIQIWLSNFRLIHGTFVVVLLCAGWA
jgi:hypothetical protein